MYTTLYIYVAHQDWLLFCFNYTRQSHTLCIQLFSGTECGDDKIGDNIRHARLVQYIIDLHASSSLYYSTMNMFRTKVNRELKFVFFSTLFCMFRKIEILVLRDTERTRTGLGEQNIMIIIIVKMNFVGRQSHSPLLTVMLLTSLCQCFVGWPPMTCYSIAHQLFWVLYLLLLSWQCYELFYFHLMQS